jgi:hypothetical protein
MCQKWKCLNAAASDRCASKSRYLVPVERQIHKARLPQLAHLSQQVTLSRGRVALRGRIYRAPLHAPIDVFSCHF